MSEYRLPKRMRTDLSSRFIKMSQAKTSSKYEVLNFGIGEDTSLLNKSTVDLIYKELNTNESLGYSDNICPELVEAFSSYAKRNYGVERREYCDYDGYKIRSKPLGHFACRFLFKCLSHFSRL